MPRAKAQPPIPPSPTRAEYATTDKVVRKLTGTSLLPKGKVGMLPIVSEVFQTEQEIQEAVTILEKGHSLKDQIDVLNGELDTQKAVGTAMALDAGVAGFRFGNLGVTVDLMEGRRTLNKDLLRSNMIEAGVDPTEVGRIIEDSHKTGEPFYQVSFKKVN